MNPVKVDRTDPPEKRLFQQWIPQFHKVHIPMSAKELSSFARKQKLTLSIIAIMERKGNPRQEVVIFLLRTG
jgi:hypothetical protein